MRIGCPDDPPVRSSILAATIDDYWVVGFPSEERDSRHLCRLRGWARVGRRLPARVHMPARTLVDRCRESPWRRWSVTVHSIVPTSAPRGLLEALSGGVIKRELYYVSAQRRNELNDEVYRLDPFADDIEPARYNPLDLIETSSGAGGQSTAIDDARSIANALVVKDEGSSQNPFFIDSARQLIFGLILYVCATESRESGERHLGKVRELLMQANSEVEDPDDDTLRGTLRKLGNFDSLDTDTETTCAEAPVSRFLQGEDPARDSFGYT
jgi:hypothetical protein